MTTKKEKMLGMCDKSGFAMNADLKILNSDQFIIGMLIKG